MAMSVQEWDPLVGGPCADWPMGTLTTAELPPRAAKPNPMQRILTRWQGGSQVKEESAAPQVGELDNAMVRPLLRASASASVSVRSATHQRLLDVLVAGLGFVNGRRPYLPCTDALESERASLCRRRSS